MITRILLLTTLVQIAGCSDIKELGTNAVKGRKSGYELFGWKAEDYFADAKVIALCRAIEADDLKEIDRFVADGVDVNAKGKGNMTPLLWSFLDDKIDRFQRLLEHGANPNVVVDSLFNTKGMIRPGHSVTHLAAMSKFPQHFEQVMLHGGDVELHDSQTQDSLLHVLVKALIPVEDKKARIQLVLAKKPNLDHLSSFDSTPTMDAIKWGGQYRIALMLLDAGADMNVYQPNSNQRLVHTVVNEEEKNRQWGPEAKSDYESIVQRLKDHGESLDEARKDLKRWQEWGQVYPIEKIKELREKEVAERMARQKADAEKKKTDKSDE